MDRSSKPLSASIIFTTAFLLALSLLAFTAPAVMAEQPLPTSVLDWNKTLEGGFHGESQQYVSCLQEYGGYLYAGVSAFLGCELWRYDGTAWEEIAGPSFSGKYGPGFGNVGRQLISRMAVYDGLLYMTPHESGTGCEVWTYDGSDLNKLVGPGLPGDYAPGFGNANNSNIHGICVFDGKLFFGTYNGTTGCEVWSYDGSALSKLVGTGLTGKHRPGFGDADNECAHSMAIYGGKLIIAAYNYEMAVRCGVTTGATSPSWWGRTRQAPPGPAPASDTSTMRTPPAWRSSWTSCMSRRTTTTAARSGATTALRGRRKWAPAFPAAARAASATTITQKLTCRCTAPNCSRVHTTIVERRCGDTTAASGSRSSRAASTTWTTNGAIAFAVYGPNLYTSMDNPTTGPEIWKAAYTFYFAEGYTGSGFQEYLCLGNPQPVDANVLVTFMFPDGTTQEEAATVPANFRSTLDVNALVGPGKDVSCKIEADQPIVAERPMYFTSGGGVAGGHDAIGATAASKDWYFAEGYTGAGFQEYICVLNPGDALANLTFRFQTQEEGEQVVGGISVPAALQGVLQCELHPGRPTTRPPSPWSRTCRWSPSAPCTSTTMDGVTT